MASRPRQMIDYLLLSGLYQVGRVLPRGLLLRMGRALGSFAWAVVRYRRDVVLDNLRQAFAGQMSEPEIRATARSFYRNLGMTLMEFISFGKLTRADILDLVEVEGWEHYEAFQALGQGGLLVSGHFGNWELMGARMAAIGPKVSFIVKPQTNQRVDHLQNDIRARVGLGVIPSGSQSREVIRALRRGELVGLVGDQDAGRDGVFTEFLGRQASVFRGTAYLAWKLKVPILTGFIFRQPDDRHKLVIDPPFLPDPEWDEETAVRRITEYHVQRLEEAVRKAPDHYYWLHRRWKTRPPEETV